MSLILFYHLLFTFILVFSMDTFDMFCFYILVEIFCSYTGCTVHINCYVLFDQET